MARRRHQRPEPLHLARPGDAAVDLLALGHRRHRPARGAQRQPRGEPHGLAEGPVEPAVEGGGGAVPVPVEREIERADIGDRLLEAEPPRGDPGGAAGAAPAGVEGDLGVERALRDRRVGEALQEAEIAEGERDVGLEPARMERRVAGQPAARQREVEPLDPRGVAHGDGERRPQAELLAGIGRLEPRDPQAERIAGRVDRRLGRQRDRLVARRAARVDARPEPGERARDARRQALGAGIAGLDRAGREVGLDAGVGAERLGDPGGQPRAVDPGLAGRDGAGARLGPHGHLRRARGGDRGVERGRGDGRAVGLDPAEACRGLEIGGGGERVPAPGGQRRLGDPGAGRADRGERNLGGRGRAALLGRQPGRQIGAPGLDPGAGEPLGGRLERGRGQLGERVGRRQVGRQARDAGLGLGIGERLGLERRDHLGEGRRVGDPRVEPGAGERGAEAGGVGQRQVELEIGRGREIGAGELAVDRRDARVLVGRLPGRDGGGEHRGAERVVERADKVEPRERGAERRDLPPAQVERRALLAAGRRERHGARERAGDRRVGDRRQRPEIRRVEPHLAGGEPAVEPVDDRAVDGGAEPLGVEARQVEPLALEREVDIGRDRAVARARGGEIGAAPDRLPGGDRVGERHLAVGLALEGEIAERRLAREPHGVERALDPARDVDRAGGVGVVGGGDGRELGRGQRVVERGAAGIGLAGQHHPARGVDGQRDRADRELDERHRRAVIGAEGAELGLPEKLGAQPVDAQALGAAADVELHGLAGDADLGGEPRRADIGGLGGERVEPRLAGGRQVVERALDAAVEAEAVERHALGEAGERRASLERDVEIHGAVGLDIAPGRLGLERRRADLPLADRDDAVLLGDVDVEPGLAAEHLAELGRDLGSRHHAEAGADGERPLEIHRRLAARLEHPVGRGGEFEPPVRERAVRLEPHARGAVLRQAGDLRDQPARRLLGAEIGPERARREVAQVVELDPARDVVGAPQRQRDRLLVALVAGRARGVEGDRLLGDQPAGDEDPFERHLVDARRDRRARPVEGLAVVLGDLGVLLDLDAALRRAQHLDPGGEQAVDLELGRQDAPRVPLQPDPLGGEPDPLAVRDLDADELGHAVARALDVLRGDREILGRDLLERELDERVLQVEDVEGRGRPRRGEERDQGGKRQGAAQGHQKACPMAM